MVIGQMTPETSSHLIRIRDLLSQNIIELVHDAAPIRTALERLRGQIPEAAEEAIFPAAYIEAHQFRVLKARQRLEDRQTAEKLRQESLVSKKEATTVKGRLDLLQSAAPMIINKIYTLKAKQEALEKELEAVKLEIATEENNLATLPTTIEETKSALAAQVRKTMSLRKKIKDIPGSSADDQRIIDTVDAIRQRALDAVQTLLGPL